MKISFPASIVIGKIDDWCIVFFEDKTFDADAPGHHYIVVPTSCGSIVVCIVTSQVKKLKAVYDANAKESLVNIDHSDFKFVDRECVIDCNRAELLSRVELSDRVKNFTKKPEEHISPALRGKIRNAIMNSNRVKGYIQTAILNS